MKKILAFAITSILLFSCVDDDNEYHEERQIPEPIAVTNNQGPIFTRLLWNHGMTTKSWVLWNLKRNPNSCKKFLQDIIVDATNNSEVSILGKPRFNYSKPYFINNFMGEKGTFTSNYVPSARIVGVAHPDNRFKKSPGFDFWWNDSSNNPSDNSSPIEFTFVNHTRYANFNPGGTHYDPSFSCADSPKYKVGEVGFMFENFLTQTTGNHAFKKKYKFLSEFDSFKLRFEAKIMSANIPSNSRAFLTADFRIGDYPIDSNGNPDFEEGAVRIDLMCVIFGDLQPNKYGDGGIPGTHIYSRNTSDNKRQIFFHGDKIGINQIKNIDRNNYTDVTIDFGRNLWKDGVHNELFAPAPDGTEAYIMGLDIYSYAQKADIAYKIRNIKFWGINN